jgi:hypothetical protein
MIHTPLEDVVRITQEKLNQLLSLKSFIFIIIRQFALRDQMITIILSQRKEMMKLAGVPQLKLVVVALQLSQTRITAFQKQIALLMPFKLQIYLLSITQVQANFSRTGHLSPKTGRQH